MRRRNRWPSGTAFATGALSVAGLVFFAALALSFLVESAPLGVAGWRELLTSDRWYYRSGAFGAAGMVFGTLAVSAIAIALAAPVGLGAAVFLSESVRPRIRPWLKGAVELLAAVPSVVYGLLGVLLLREWMYRALRPFDALSGDTLATGGVLLAVMVLPTVVTLADDALQGVSRRQRLAARALGLTRSEAVRRVVLPQAAPGLTAAVLLGVGRALGETIAVFLVVGRLDAPLPNPLWSPQGWADAGQTVTSKLGGPELFLAGPGSPHAAALMGLCVLLLAVTAGITLAGLRLSGRRRA